MTGAAVAEEPQAKADAVVLAVDVNSGRMGASFSFPNGPCMAPRGNGTTSRRTPSGTCPRA
jgi:hypothetical protein